MAVSLSGGIPGLGLQSSLDMPVGPFLNMQAEIRELSALCPWMGMAGEQAAEDGVGQQECLPDLGVGALKRMVRNYS